MRVLSDQDVLQGGHITEQADILIGPGNPQVSDLVGCQTLDGRSVEQHLPAFGGVKTGDAVEQGGFPGAIGANNAGNGMFWDNQVNLIYGGQAAEHFSELMSLKVCLHVALPRWILRLDRGRVRLAIYFQAAGGWPATGPQAAGSSSRPAERQRTSNDKYPVHASVLAALSRQRRPG